MIPYQIFSCPRHLRYIFFIDSATPYPALLDLVKINLRIWGGRYNPIVPVKGGAISPEYQEVVKWYDPDVVFYSGTVDPTLIQQLRLFNPSAYVNLDKQPMDRGIGGLSSLHLIAQVDRDRPVILPGDLWKTESALLDYLQLNFGITPHGYVGDSELTKNREQIRVGHQDLGALHQLLHTKRPVNFASLAARHLHTKVLRSSRHAYHDSVELVIAADTTRTEDLLYWWNRRLYEGETIFYLTMDQLALLQSDPFFGGVLHDNSSRQMIDVVSMSLTQSETEKVIETLLKPTAFHRLYRYKPIECFPFPVDDDNGFTEAEQPEPATLQLLGAGENLLSSPSLSFTDSIHFGPQQWAIDLRVVEALDGKSKEVLFPKTTDTRHILRGVEGRINRQHELSYYVRNQHRQQTTVELRVPSFPHLLHQLISSPVIDGTTVKTIYQDIEVRDCGNRLLSFLRLFGYDFDTIGEYLSDKFWMDMLEDCCKSEKAVGDAVCFPDLVTRCRHLMEAEGLPFGPRSTSWRNRHNLMLGLKTMVAELTALKILIPGYKFKCPHCANIAWYPIEEVAAQTICSGCRMDFLLPVDPSISYRLNTLVQKNFYQSHSQPDGNGTVIQTLVRLARRARGTFTYSAQMDLYSDLRTRKPVTDLDILALEGGEFDIGEAKYDSKEFNKDGHKCLHALAAIAKAIRPDRIILSCTVDEADRLQKAKKFLEGLFYQYSYTPDIEAFQISEPSYFNFKGGKYFYY